MTWPSGEVISTQKRLRRLSGAIPTSYTIFKMDDTYYAECNVPGGTEYSGTDASTVIQYAIDALSSGGKIFFKSGLYYFNSTITIPYIINVVLEGETFGKYPQLSLGSILIKNFNGTLLNFTGDVTNRYTPFTIRNLGLNGCPAGGDWIVNAKTGTMISASYRRFAIIENTRVYRNAGIGIHLDNCGVWRLKNVEVSEFKGGAGVYADTCPDWQIYDLECNVGYGTSSNIEHGLHIGDSSTGQIFGGHFEGYRGIYSTSAINVIGAYIPWCYDTGIWSTAAANSITDCVIVNGNVGDIATGSAIIVGPRSVVKGCYVAGSHFKYGVYSYGDTRITSNTFEVMGGATEIIRTGQGDIAHYNYGFVTENSGSDTIASGFTSKQVAHGLDVTPLAEHFSIIGKEDPTNSVGTVWVDTIGDTYFTVNVENDPGASNWDFGWKVIVTKI